jgi:predicted TIM-barrel fold metal-dependent hydrolase
VRHLIHNEPNLKWLLQAVFESLRLLADRGPTFDVVATARAYECISVLSKVPNLKIVIDHLANPHSYPVAGTVGKRPQDGCRESQRLR